MTISRRGFLRTATLAALSAPLWNARRAFSAEKESVIVIGAGMAGISAARDLQSRGFEVLVLEGRDRLGGRIWTNRSLGKPIDLGASWIQESDGNPLTELATQFHAKTRVTDFDDLEVYDFDGTPLPDQEVEKFGNDFEELIKEVENYGETVDREISFGTALKKVLQSHSPGARARRFLNAMIAGMVSDAAADLDDLSLWAEEDEGFSGEDLLFPDGYDQLIVGLSKGLDIRLKHRVVAIDYSGKKVKVETDRKTFQADYVVVTIPLGILKMGSIQPSAVSSCMASCHGSGKSVSPIRFSPSLPLQKQKAIERLGMGVLNKVALRFDVDPDDWPVESHFVVYASKKEQDFMEILNMNLYGAGPILVAFTGGSLARSLEPLADDEIVKQMMGVLRTIYGKEVPDPAGNIVTRWMMDPFAGGSYSYIRVGSRGEDYDALMEPIHDRVFFAGEATNRKYPATVHGAFLSGLREAHRIDNL